MEKIVERLNANYREILVRSLFLQKLLINKYSAVLPVVVFLLLTMTWHFLLSSIAYQNRFKNFNFPRVNICLKISSFPPKDLKIVI